VWGALVGAVVGAFVAWLVPLALQRRETNEGDRTRLNTAVADVVRLLGEADGAVEAFIVAIRLGNPRRAHSASHLAHQQLLSAILAARTAAGDHKGLLPRSASSSQGGTT